VLTGDQTATNFTADPHIKLFQQTFKNLQFDNLSNFAIAQVADSTALNPKIARVMGIKHIACRNHCLNLGCKDMEKHSSELRDVANMTQEVHPKVKASNKLIAELENAQACYRQSDATGKTGGGGWLKIKAATRWNSLEGLLKSHINCIEAIRQVISSHPERDISDETTSQNFVKEIMKHLPYLTHLKSASVSMQKRMASLDECQFHCDLVASCASNGYGEAGNDFCYCK
jgi:hypothetical protein